MRCHLEIHSKPSCARRAGAPPNRENPAGALGIPECMPPDGGRIFRVSSALGYCAGMFPSTGDGLPVRELK